jgi:hypothetical protein
MNSATRTASAQSVTRRDRLHRTRGG